MRKTEVLPSSQDSRERTALQRNLLQAWSDCRVEEYYQTAFLSYLETLPPPQAHEQIQREIRETHDGHSTYFELNRKLNDRKRSLSHLCDLVGTEVNPDDELMGGVCKLLGSLRDDNLIVAETLIQLHRHCRAREDVSDECRAMLLHLDEDNSFLKESFLNQFILFQQGYDPFFLHHYDLKGKRAPRRPSSTVDQLFTFGINYACRLFKAQTQVLEMLSDKLALPVLKDQDTPKTTPTPNYSTIIPQQSSPSPAETPTFKKTSANFRKRNLSLNNAKEKERKEQSRLSQSKPQPQDTPPATPVLNRDKLKLALKQRDQEEPPKREQERFWTEEDEQEEVMFRRRLRRAVTKEEQEEPIKLAPLKFRIKRSLVRPLEHPSRPLLTEADEDRPDTIDAKPKLHPLQNHYRRRMLKPREQKPQTEVNPLELFRRHARKTQERRQDPRLQSLNVSQQESQTDSTSKLKETIQIDTKNGNNKKQIKMRAGKYSLPELLTLLKSLKLEETLRKTTVCNPKWQQYLQKCQSYVSEFTVNAQLAAVGVTMVLPEGDYMIKLWAPVDCQGDTSVFLFQKYVDYLEKMTTAVALQYNGQPTREVLAARFFPRKERLLVRERSGTVPPKERQFPPFLSLKCSNIRFPQDTPTPRLSSDEIEPFSPSNSYVAASISNISRSDLTSNLLMAVKISEEITDMRALNSLLQDEEFDTYEVAAGSRIAGVSAVRVALQTAFKVPFVAGEGYMRMAGEEVGGGEGQVVVRVGCERGNARLLLGQGFGSIAQFVAAAGGSGREPCEFSVKMFSKQLYGRIGSEWGRYGNWEISLSWQDELQGRVRHPMTDCLHFGPESFHVGVEMEGLLLYAFLVREEDFLF